MADTTRTPQPGMGSGRPAVTGGALGDRRAFAGGEREPQRSQDEAPAPAADHFAALKANTQAELKQALEDIDRLSDMLRSSRDSTIQGAVETARIIRVRLETVQRHFTTLG